MSDAEERYLTFVGEEIGAERDGFTVTDHLKAEWCLATAKAAQARKDARVREYQEKIEMVDRWRAREDAADDATLLKMTLLLEPYFAQVKAAGGLGARKRLQLPSGWCGPEVKPESWQRHDPALLAWVKAQGLSQFIKVTEEVQWGELKKHLAPVEPERPFSAACWVATGEMVDGVTLERPKHEVFAVKPQIG
jgi:Bacteriophage Mu Gam like protein